MKRETRNKVMKRAKGYCEICGNLGSEVHHKHYLTFGYENEEDLLYLCRRCHQEIHDNELN